MVVDVHALVQYAHDIDDAVGARQSLDSRSCDAALGSRTFPSLSPVHSTRSCGGAPSVNSRPCDGGAGTLIRGKLQSASEIRPANFSNESWVATHHKLIPSPG